MTWGDVLWAAIGACAAGGIHRKVNRRKLAQLIDEINAVSPPRPY